MPSIFDDIKIEELSDYTNHQALEEYNRYLDELNAKNVEQNARRGFLLSYGQNGGVIPVGTFVLTGYEDKDGAKVDELDAIINNGFVVFEEIEKKDNHVRIKPQGNRIVMPYRTYTYAFKIVNHNNAEFGLLSGDQGITPNAVDDIKDIYSEALAEKRPGADIKMLNLYGSKLDDAHALYTNANNEDLGSNYTVYPFDLVLGMYMDSDLVFNSRYDETYGLLR